MGDRRCDWRGAGDRGSHSPATRARKRPRGPHEGARALRHRLATEFETATHVFLVKGHRITHLLHLLLSVITFGVWLLVWLAIAMFGGQRRRTVTKT